MASRFVVEIITDNAAWRDPLDSDAVDLDAVAAKLRELADRVSEGSTRGGILDANGNASGQYYGEEN